MAELAPTPRSQIRLALIGSFYVAVLAFGCLLPLTSRAGVPPLAWFVSVATVVLYGVASVITLARRPADPRVGVFAVTGILVTTSILLPAPPVTISPHWLAVVLSRAYPALFLMNFAVFIHLAAMIPRRNPIAVRHPVLIPGNYVAGALLVLTAAVLDAGGTPPALPWRTTLTLFQVMNGATYLWAGVLGLALLGYAALHEASAAGRRQAAIVFSVLLPWTLNIGAWLLLPSIVYPTILFRTVEPFVILLIPAGFFVAILGFRLFEAGSLVRKGLIYGLTTGALGVALYASMAGVGELLGRALGVTFGAWNTAILLVLTGAALAPLLRRVTHVVDTMFFPEKVALRQLRQTVIPALAGPSGLDAAAARLVSLLHESLRLKNASLLVADDARAFFRVRAQSGDFADAKTYEAVLTRDEIRLWLGPARGGALRTERVLGKPGSVSEELRRMQHLLEAAVAVPIGVDTELVGLLVLGPSLSGTELDTEDVHLLEDVTRQASAMLENARLFDLATRDPLTGLPRRQVFEERLAQELERCRRHFEAFALALADLDDFKRVNDSRGHLAGDQVLRAIATVLSDHTRKSDLVARYGGDEFAFLFPHTDHDGALHLPEMLRRRVEEHAIGTEGGPPLPVTISFGVHVVRPEDTETTPEDLIRFADRALYEAKRLGKNRTAVYDPESPRNAAPNT